MRMDQIIAAMNIGIGQVAATTNAPSVQNNCYECKHSRDVPGNCHIQCVKPDTNMTGHLHGIKRGWFMYPLLFDPVWMTAKCENFESVNPASKSSGKPE